MAAARPPDRRVVIVAFEGAQILDVTGPAEVFAVANRFLDAAQRPYDIEIAATTAGPVRCSGGVGLVAARRLGDVRDVDTLLVSGGFGVEHALADDELLDALRRLTPRARRFGSVCTGAFLLGAIGALDGKRVTTHWHDSALLQALVPSAHVDADAIFVRDGPVSTSAGVTAGIDLALALVEEDHGRVLSARVARQLVVFLQRPGGQSQYSSHLSARPADRASVRDVQAWIADHLTADLSVPALADRAAMSVRNFARVFRSETGTTPADFVEATRIEHAKRWLESTSCGLAEVAAACGLGTTETFHRAFKRRVGVTPGEFRARFRPAHELSGSS